MNIENKLQGNTSSPVLISRGKFEYYFYIFVYLQFGD